MMNEVYIPSGKEKRPYFSARRIAILRNMIIRKHSDDWKALRRMYNITSGHPSLRTSDGWHWVIEKLKLPLHELYREVCALDYDNGPNEARSTSDDSNAAADTSESEATQGDVKNNEDDMTATAADMVNDAMNNGADTSNIANVEKIIRDLAHMHGLDILLGDEVSKAAQGTFTPRPRSSTEYQHRAFPDLLDALQASKQTGGAFSVMLVGPKATGKTSACRSAAKALELPFYLQSTAIESFQLEGFVDGNGNYHCPQFVQAFRDGGIMLLDELDAWAPSALIALNAPLSVGIMALPNGDIIEKHPNFICVGAANTFGQGASHEYNAREKLDDATLSRFAVKITWLRDYVMERAIATNKQWCDECHAASHALLANGLPDSADLRAILAGEALLAGGMDIRKVRHATYLAGLSPDQVKMLKDYLAREGKSSDN